MVCRLTFASAQAKWTGKNIWLFRHRLQTRLEQQNEAMIPSKDPGSARKLCLLVLLCGKYLCQQYPPAPNTFGAAKLPGLILEGLESTALWSARLD